MAKILVFERDARVAEALKAAVASLGHEGVVAPDGYSVLPMAEQHRPAMFILEYKFPEADGFEILQRLRAKPEFAGVPVLFASETSKMELEMVVMDTPKVGYLDKPIDGLRLRAEVEAFLPPAAPPPSAAPKAAPAAAPAKPAFTGEADLDGQRDGVIDLD